MTAVRLTRAVQARKGRSGLQDADRHIATRVRARRIMLGLTQQQLAGLLGRLTQRPELTNINASANRFDHQNMKPRFLAVARAAAFPCQGAKRI